MDMRVKPAYDDLDAWAVSYNARTGLQRRAAQKIFRFHRLLAGALQFENSERALLAGDREMIVEHFTRGTRATGHGAAQDFDAHLLALDRHLGPCAGKRRQPVNIAQHISRGPVPIDPRLGLFD